MPKAFPVEFRNDVVAVARKGESTLVQIAKDFGISSAIQRREPVADALVGRSRVGDALRVENRGTRREIMT